MSEAVASVANLTLLLTRLILTAMLPNRTEQRQLLIKVLAVLLIQYPVGVSAENDRFNPVSREVIETRLKQYGGSNTQREATLRRLFNESGCDNQHLSEQIVKGSKLPNVMCTLPGTSDNVIIIGAHFDHVSYGDGVVDNWSGASLLPSLYEAMKSNPRKHTYIFIGFTDEEKGEVGSRFYVRQMTNAQVAAIDAMVNMDSLGLAPAEIWTSHSDKLLVSALAAVAAQLKIPITGVNVEQVGSSDAEQFAQRKIPRITIHSLTQEAWNARILHTSKDRISQIKLGDYYQTYHLLSAYISYLDQFTGATEPSKNH